MKHLDNDPDFEEACADAIDAYGDKILAIGRKCATEGAVTKRYDKDDRLIDTQVSQSIPILMMEMKRVEKDYRDKPIVDVTALGGGVLLAPSGLAPIDWVKAQAETNEMKEVNGRDGEDTDG